MDRARHLGNTAFDGGRAVPPAHFTVTRRQQLFLLYTAIVALAFVASATGLANGFALDDVALIADNARVHSLDHWWRLFALPYWPAQYGASLYRPVVTVGYAIQWSAAAGAPWIFHMTSVVLYAAVAALVLALFLEFVRPAAAFVGASLFAVHPVHVEAVANVIGQSELLAALASLGALVIYVRARRAGVVGPAAVAAIGLLFAVACLCKEHALLLPILLIAVEWFSVGKDQTTRASVGNRVRAMASLFATLATVAVAYLIVRTAVVGELLGEKHLVPVYGLKRLWVMLVVAPHWVRLLAWPARLSAEYSPQHIVIPGGPGPDILPGLGIMLALGAAFVALGRGDERGGQDRATAQLALGWLAITLLPVSNLFSVMLVAERTLLMPSVGAMLLVAAATSTAMAHRTSPRSRTIVRIAGATVLAALTLAGVVRSRDRQRVWRDDTTLFAQTADDAPRSYRAQFFYGQMLFLHGKRAEGEHRLRLAIELNPTPSDVSPLNFLATQYRDAGMCPQALPLYERALANDAERPDVRYGLASCLLATGRVVDARRLAEDGVRRGDLKGLFLELMARTDSAGSHTPGG